MCAFVAREPLLVRDHHSREHRKITYVCKGCPPANPYQTRYQHMMEGHALDTGHVAIPWAIEAAGEENYV
jgi:hypothetical protein